jgi:hypothetical protein
LPCRDDSYSGLASYDSALYSKTENQISRVNVSGNVADSVDGGHIPARDLRAPHAGTISRVNFRRAVQRSSVASYDVTKDSMPWGKMAQIVIGSRPTLTLGEAIERFVEQRSEACMSFAPDMEWFVTPWGYNIQAGRYEQAGESARFHPLHILDGINQRKGRKGEKNR